MLNFKKIANSGRSESPAGRKVFQSACSLMLALSMLTVIAGCDKENVKTDDDAGKTVIIYEIPDDDGEVGEGGDVDEIEDDTQAVEYSPSLYYDYWNKNLVSKYGAAKPVKVSDEENEFAMVTGSASVRIADIDNDGKDEMIHVLLGQYGDNKDSMILEVYEFTGGRVKKSASAVIDESMTYYGNGSASVFLSWKDGECYLCFEEFGDLLGEARLTEYLILQYNGKDLKHCKSIVDPGFTSERAVFMETKGKSFKADKNGVSVFRTDYDGWETLFYETYEENAKVTGNYADYKKALTSELSEYGISLHFSGSVNLGVKQNAKSVTRICRHIITYVDNNDNTVTLNAVLCDYTGCLYHLDEAFSQSVELDSKRQYNMNIYLSNFAEVDLPSFIGMPDTNDLISFGIYHNIKNNSAKTVDTKVSDEYSYRMSIKNISSKIYKYFLIRTVESNYSAYAKSDDFMTYKNGYLYSTDVLEGAPWGDFTVVSKIESLGGNIYRVTFSNYDINQFYDRKSGEDEPYSLTPAEVKKLKFTKDKEGTALIYASDLAKRATYRLLAYNLKG